MAVKLTVFRCWWFFCLYDSVAKELVNDVQPTDVTEGRLELRPVRPCNGGTCPQSQCCGSLLHDVDVVKLNAQNVAVTDTELPRQRYPI